jgi:hypothetical protein
MAASCRTGRKDRAQLNDATLSRGPIAKTGAAFRSVRKSASVTHGPAARVSERSAGRCRGVLPIAHQSRSWTRQSARLRFGSRPSSRGNNNRQAGSGSRAPSNPLTPG